VLDGAGGADLLRGGALNDVLIGGAGNDSLRGGAGKDRYLFDDDWGQDIVVELIGGGVDTLDFSGVSIGIQVQIGSDVSVQSGNNSLTSAGTTLEGVIGSASGDSFFTSPNAAIELSLAAGSGENDALIYNSMGVASVQTPTTLHTTGFQAVQIVGFDSVQIVNAPEPAEAASATPVEVLYQEPHPNQVLVAKRIHRLGANGRTS
jgi:hypothetical protein